jgi:L-asparaginase II
MLNTDQLPLFELTRGELVESLHYGSIAISDSQGRLVGWYGDPHTKTFLRSSAKPFQALPFIEQNGQDFFDLSLGEIALICASHSGTDQHVSTIQSIQKKTGVSESELQCGIHPVFDSATGEKIRERGEELTSNRHNCSGKHTGMLAFAHMQNWSVSDYLELDHNVQIKILSTFSEMSGVPVDEIVVGIDGCSAPNFAVPLHNTALAYARLCDPEDLSDDRAAACKTITSAMTSNSFMVGGPGRFDTRLMEVSSGQIVSKGGAEGYQALGIMPGALGPDSPALGIALKISDGDLRSRARPAVSLEILRQLKVLNPAQEKELSEYGPTRPLKNFREIEVGESNPVFQLNLILPIFPKV